MGQAGEPAVPRAAGAEAVERHGAHTARRRVLIAGAGVAALEAFLALRELAGERAEIVLLAPTGDFVYRPLTVLEPFEEVRARRLALGPFARDHGASHIFDRLAQVEPERRRARTASGEDFDYDALVVAVGARPVEAVPGALTFPGPGGVSAFRDLLAALERGECRAVAFTLPRETAWTLPLYELALLTASWLTDRGGPPAELTVVTPEKAPLAAFGDHASASVSDLLERHGVHLHAGVAPRAARDGALELEADRSLHAERTVALPRLVGPSLPGLPHDDDGFLPVDPHGRVEGVAGVYGAGDVTTSPMKQGGLAAQQADAVAESIAEWVGAPVRPSPFRPVLRGVLLSGEDSTYLRSDTLRERTRSLARIEPLWWPPAKVAGHHLAPYLAARGIDVAEHTHESAGA